MRRIALLGPVLLLGCTVGRGEGWVSGSLWVESCKEGLPLERPGDFDLNVDFFTGDPVEDSSPTTSLRRNSLTVRLQNTSNNVEEADGLFIQLSDLRVAAMSLAQGEPMPISSKSPCAGACADPEILRARLYLYASCPECHQAIIGTSREVLPAPPEAGRGAGCLLSSGNEAAACPVLTDADRQELDAICAGDFQDRTRDEAIGRLLGSGACLYLCQLGAARRGQSAAELESFRIDFGDQVAALLSMQVVDARGLDSSACASASGALRGMFSFEVRRGRSAQAFP